MNTESREQVPSGESKRPGRAERFAAARSKYMTDRTFVMLLSVVVGLLAGLGAYVLKLMVGYIADHIVGTVSQPGFSRLYLLVPVTGIMLTVIYQHYILGKNIEHGVKRMLSKIAKRDYRLDGDITYAPLLASTLTLGFGGSAGGEGPIAYVGGAIGSNLARLSRLRPELVCAMIGIGAGAGIAGIFKAPLGGVLFTLEVMRMELTGSLVIALLLAASVAAATAFILSGYTPDVVFTATGHTVQGEMLCVAAFGIFCGIYSLYYSGVMGMMQRFYDRMPGFWGRGLLSGAILSALIFAFPALYGEGYGIIGHVLSGDGAAMAESAFGKSGMPTVLSVILISGAVIAVKAFATSASNSGGGVAGDFAPTLFAGCAAGVFFSSTVNYLFGANLSVADYAFIGMAAVMAGAIRAPFMAVFIVVEMTFNLTLVVPLALGALLSFGVVRCRTAIDFYGRRHGLSAFEYVREKILKK